MLTARYGHLELLKFLHQNGAMMEYEKGAGCLHAACYGGDHETLKYLFEVA